MIIKRIDSSQKRRAAETTEYIMDKEHAGEKLTAAGAKNCFSETIDGAQAEMSADERAYGGPGNAVAHWVASFRVGENPTPEQAEEFVTEFLRDQGMGTHKAAWALHGNTEHTHIHIAILRVKPEPEPSGSYKLQNFGGRELRGNGTTHEVLSARATVIDFAKRHGFTPGFSEIKKERHPDAIQLSQKIEAAEAQNGHPHPKRLIAEQARDVLRKSNSWGDVFGELHKYGIGFVIKDGYRGEKYWQGAVITGPHGEKIQLSALPKDCSLKNLQARFAGEGRSVEASKTASSKGFYEKALTANSAKFHARQIFNSVGSLVEAEKLLSAKGMTLERQGKSGCYLRYGEADDQKMKLSALGGKYSLSALSKKYNGKITANASFMDGSQLKVNGLSMENLATRANDRATAADARAASIAGEAVQATTLEEALSDADAQAVALDAARRAHAQAARAEARAEQAEAREKALKQQIENQQEKTMDLKPTHEKATAEQSTVIEDEASKTKNPTPDNPQDDQDEKAIKIDISLDLCDLPPGIATADPAQDNAQTGPRPR